MARAIVVHRVGAGRTGNEKHRDEDVGRRRANVWCLRAGREA